MFSHASQYLLYVFYFTKITVHRTVILSVVLNGCETWSVMLREERNLRELKNLFGPKTDQVIGEWRRLHNEKLYALKSSPADTAIRVIK
jgi:hypothetical protein